MKKKHAPSQDEDRDPRGEIIDGARIAAQILMRMEPEAKAKAIKKMQAAAPEVLEKVQEKMVSLQDLAKLSPKSVQTLLREVDQRDLSMALSSVSETDREKVLQNVPARRRDELLEEVAEAKSLSPLEVKSAEKRIVVKLDQLKEQGKVFEKDDEGTWA